MANEPTPKLPLEIIPSSQGDLSAIGSAHASFLYFESAPAFGAIQGVIQITLTANRILPIEGTQVGMDRVVVAHLRMNIPAALSLKSAIDGALLLATPTGNAAADEENPTEGPKPN